MKVAGREKKVLYAGVVLAAAILVYYAASTFLPDGERVRGDVETQKELLLRQRTLLAQEGAYKKRADATQGELAQVMTRLLPGDNASVAGAELQRILKEFADQNDVEITQKNNLAERKVPDSDSLVKVSVRIETNCGLDELVDFLTAIENYEKFLKVEELVINSIRVQKQYRIRPSLTVVGYINVPAAPAAPDADPAGNPSGSGGAARTTAVANR
ncbi:MAG: type II secretion system protein M [Acidobacteriota bacterium]|nr:type II secretion system protein M [Acidobacteriota bacterium]